jgi:uncharacterized membrane protein
LVWVLTAWLASAIALVPHALAQAPTLTILDRLAGQFETNVSAVSADGRVITGNAGAVGGGLPYVWSAATGYTQFGLPGVFSLSKDLTDDGSLTVGSGYGSDMLSHTYRYSNGTYTRIFEPAGYSASAANGVSGDGSVIVGEIGRPTGGRRAMRWTAATGMVDVGRPRASDLASDFTGISRDGATAIGKSTGPTESTDAFTWTQEGGWRLLPVFPGTTGFYESTPLNTTSDGSRVVGTVEFATGGPRRKAVLWHNASDPIDLGTLGSNTSMSANGVADDGRVIVGSAWNRDPQNSAPASGSIRSCRAWSPPFRTPT